MQTHRRHYGFAHVLDGPVVGTLSLCVLPSLETYLITHTGRDVVEGWQEKR